MSKTPPTLLYVDVDLFMYGVVFVLDKKHWENGDIKRLVKKEFSATYKEQGYNDLKASALDMNNFDGVHLYGDIPGLHVVYIPNWKSTAYWHSVLMHELIHVLHHSMDRAGLSLTDSSEEAYAYSMGLITRELLRKLWV